MERLEALSDSSQDMLDVLIAESRKDEKKTTLDDFVKELKKEGKL